MTGPEPAAPPGDPNYLAELENRLRQNQREKPAPVWAFGGADDEVPDVPSLVPPGFNLQRGVPRNAKYGQLFVCRSCGAVVGPRPANLSDHVAFHDHLQVLDNFLRMRYTAENPRPT